MFKNLRRFFSTDAHTVVHCAVVLELIAIVCLAAMGSISNTAHAAPHDVASPIVSNR